MSKPPLIALVVFLGPVLAVIVLGAQHTSGTPPAAASSAALEVSVLDFGAVCDGRTDDSKALQAALDDVTRSKRTLRLPGRTCVFATPLIAGGGRQNQYDHISVVGFSEDASRLLYIGPNNRVAITLSHVGYFRWENLSITRTNAADFKDQGTSVGMLLTGPFGTGGTMTLAGTFNHVAVEGFKYGMVYGGDDAASEIACFHCRFHLNTVGWTASGYNSLNFSFYNLDLSSNTRGMEIGGDHVFGAQATDGPHVFGGATAGNTEADFVIGNQFGIVTIENVRAEPVSRFVKAPAAGVANQLVLRHNSVTPQTRPGDGIVVEVQSFGLVLMEQNTFAGKVAIGTTTGGRDGTSLVMRQNLVESAPSGMPIILPTSSRGLHLTLERNQRYNRNGNLVSPFPDFVGMFSSNLTPWQTASTDIDDPPGGGISLNAVRMLAYGSAARGRNLRDRVVFRGDRTAAVTFKRTVAVDVVAGNNRTLAFAPGVITPADIGKTIVLPAANTRLCQPPDTPVDDVVSARITDLLDESHAAIATLANSAGRCLQEVGKTGTINDAVLGEDEPDANYFLLLSCNSNDRVWWTDKSATGFTLMSDNPTSRAVCDVLLVR